MRFSEFKYERPNLEKVKKEITELLDLIGTNQTFEVELKSIHDYFKISDTLGTLGQLVGIRNSIDTTNEFYEKEQEFFDENMPHMMQFDQMFVEKILKSPNRKLLEKELGSLMFQRDRKSVV